MFFDDWLIETNSLFIFIFLSGNKEENQGSEVIHHQYNILGVGPQFLVQSKKRRRGRGHIVSLRIPFSATSKYL